MNDIDKTRIGFAIALLAALFTLGPVVNDSQVVFNVFNLDISIKILYWIFVSLLAISVYFYAFTLIGVTKVQKIFQIIGNYSYAFALIFPILILSVYLISRVLQLFTTVESTSSILGIISSILSLIMAIVSWYTSKRFKKIDERQNAERIKKQEIQILIRADELIKSDMYDLAVIELWRLLELSFEKTFSLKAIPYDKKRPSQMLEIIHKHNLLPEPLLKELLMIRHFRNKAAHSVGEVSKEEALRLKKITEKILAITDGYKEKCYFCGRNFPLTDLEVEDTNGDYYVCKECAEKHPGWKDEIIALGMDP